jgi:hypothetical protein
VEALTPHGNAPLLQVFVKLGQDSRLKEYDGVTFLDIPTDTVSYPAPFKCHKLLCLLVSWMQPGTTVQSLEFRVHLSKARPHMVVLVQKGLEGSMHLPTPNHITPAHVRRRGWMGLWGDLQELAVAVDHGPIIGTKSPLCPKSWPQLMAVAL